MGHRPRRMTLEKQLQERNRELQTQLDECRERLARQTAELRSANVELESFSHIVSHNLRAPLRAIGGYARLIQESGPPELSPAAVEYLGKLSNSAAMMGQLIDGLLVLSRNHRAGLIIETLDMAALVQDSWAALAADRSGRQITLTVGDLPEAEGDERMLRLVWTNLLQNAIKYTSKRSQALVSVTADQRDGVVRYRVEDNGVGFDMKYADKIGQVFQRLHDGSEYPGTGIGMAGVQQVVLRHGGTLVVHGELEVGAAMEFSLWERR